MWQPLEQQEESVISYPSFHAAVVLRLPARSGIDACVAAVPMELVSLCLSAATPQRGSWRLEKEFPAPPTEAALGMGQVECGCLEVGNVCFH